MELPILVRVSLIRNVPANFCRTTMLSNRADVVAIRPELAAPQLLLHAGHPLEYFACRETFDDAHDLGRAVTRNRLHQEMHVGFVCPDLQKNELVAARNLQTHFAQNSVPFWGDHRSSILRRTHDVIQQQRSVRTFVIVRTSVHSPILPNLRGKPRGMSPPDSIKQVT